MRKSGMFHVLRRAGLLALVASVLVGVVLVAAANAQSLRPCPGGNLLTQANPTLGDELSGISARLLVDGVIVRNGLAWPSHSNLVTLRKGSITYDLGAEYLLRTVYIQLDADQAVRISLGDEAQSWQTLRFAAHQSASGMLMRALELPGTNARYVRVSAEDTIMPLAMTEFGVSCEANFMQRAQWRIVGLPPDNPPVGLIATLWSKFTGKPGVDMREGYAIKGVIVLAAAIVLMLMMRSPAPRRRLDAALIVLGLVATLAYSNFGAYHYPDSVHVHDVFHYFVGAKYFDELKYTDLYACASVAEADAGFRQRVLARAQRDLRTNSIVSGEHVLDAAAHCREKFSPARWESFAEDVAYFANRSGIPGWHKILKDHGFNASPVWVALGSSIASRLPARSWSIGEGDSIVTGLIAPLDPLLLLIAAIAVAWALGWRTACVGLVLFGCNPLSQYQWVGGGFLRQPWLVALIIGLCLLYKERWFTAGVLLACSALLQVFPSITLLAPLLAVTIAAAKRRLPERADITILGGAIVAAAVIIPLSSAACETAGVWKLFLDNSLKHAGTASANLIGLPTVLSFRFANRSEILFDPNQTDPFAAVRAVRASTLGLMRPLHIAIAGTYFWLVVRRLGRGERMHAAVLCLTLLPFVTDESCYYLAWLAALGLCWSTRPLSLLPLLAVHAGSLCILLLVPGSELPYVCVSAWVICGMLAFVWVTGLSAARDSARALAPGPLT